jgi:hypothetical protein
MARKPTGRPNGRPRKQAAQEAAALAAREGIPVSEAVERVPGAKLSTAYDAAQRQAAAAIMRAHGAHAPPRPTTRPAASQARAIAKAESPDDATGEPIARLRSLVANDPEVVVLVEDLLADDEPEDVTTLDRVRRLIRRTERRALVAKEQRFGTLGTLLDRLYARERQLLGPPPVRPDAVLEELRRLDGEVLARIEQHAAEPITSQEIH